MWLELRKDASAKVAIVNKWLSTYKDLVSLLTRFTGQSTVKIAIEKLVETEESIQRFYESNVQIHAQGEDLVKLSSTKPQFD